MSALGYVGAAYAAFWIVIFVYVWRLTAISRDLSDRLDKLERKQSSHDQG